MNNKLICNCEGCKNEVKIQIVSQLKGNIYCCKEHYKSIDKKITGYKYSKPVNCEEYKADRSWNLLNEFNKPEENKKIIISDGIIVDTAVIRDGYYFIHNFRNFIGKILFWKYEV